MDIVTVTGTLIRGTRTVGSPVVSLTRTDLERSPAATVVDLLRDLPQIANLGASDTHLSTTQTPTRTSRRARASTCAAWGPNRPWCWSPGRRMSPRRRGRAVHRPSPSSGPGRRAPGGGDRRRLSATYGRTPWAAWSTRLRRNFSGAEAMLRYGSADGMHQKQAGLIVGTQWAGGSAMLALDGNSRSELNATVAPSSSDDDLRPWGRPDLRVFNAAPGNADRQHALRHPAGQNGIGLAASRLVAGTATTKRPPRRERAARAGAQWRRLQCRAGLTDSVTLTLEASGASAGLIAASAPSPATTPCGRPTLLRLAGGGRHLGSSTTRSMATPARPKSIGFRALAAICRRAGL